MGSSTYGRTTESAHEEIKIPDSENLLTDLEHEE